METISTGDWVKGLAKIVKDGVPVAQTDSTDNTIEAEQEDTEEKADEKEKENEEKKKEKDATSSATAAKEDADIVHIADEIESGNPEGANATEGKNKTVKVISEPSGPALEEEKIDKDEKTTEEEQGAPPPAGKMNHGGPAMAEV